MNEIFYRLVDLPTSVRGFTIPDENGDYNIYINSNLSDELLDKTVKHELEHIQSGDFEKDYLPGDMGKNNV